MNASKPTSSFGAFLWGCAIVGLIWFANVDTKSSKRQFEPARPMLVSSTSTRSTVDPESPRKLEAVRRALNATPNATLATSPPTRPSTSTSLVPRQAGPSPAQVSRQTLPTQASHPPAPSQRDSYWNSEFESVQRQYADNPRLPRPARTLTDLTRSELFELWSWNSEFESVQRQYEYDAALPRPQRNLAALSRSDLFELWSWNSEFESVQRQYQYNSNLPRPQKSLASLSRSELFELWSWNSEFESVRRQYETNPALPRPAQDLGSLTRSELSALWFRNSSATASWPAGVAENGSYYGEPNQNGVPKTVHVNGYFRSDGTYVRGYYRSPPGSNPRGLGHGRR